MHFSQQPYKDLYQGFTGRPNRPSNRLVNPWPWYLLSRASWKCETHRSVIFNLISSKLVNSPTALPSKSKSWMVTFIRLAGFSRRSWTLFYWLDSWLIAHESWTMSHGQWLRSHESIRKPILGRDVDFILGRTRHCSNHSYVSYVSKLNSFFLTLLISIYHSSIDFG